MTIFILVIQNIYKINKKTAKRHSSGGDQKTITQNNLFLHITLKNTKELQNLSKINKEAPRKVEWNSRVLFFNEGQKNTNEGQNVFKNYYRVLQEEGAQSVRIFMTF